MKNTKTEQNPQSVGQTFELDGNIYKGTYLEAKKIFNETFANADFEEIPPFEYWVENTDMFQIEEQVGHTPGEFKPTINELLVWTIHITSINDGVFYFYADGRLIARLEDCEDSMEAISEFGKKVCGGGVEFTEDLRNKP